MNEISDQLELSSGEIQGTIFGFDGDIEKVGDRGRPGYGAAIGFSLEREETEFSLDFAYISDIGDTGKLQEVISGALGSNNVADHVPGWTASARLRYENPSLLGKYLASLGRFGADEWSYDDSV